MTWPPACSRDPLANFFDRLGQRGHCPVALESYSPEYSISTHLACPGQGGWYCTAAATYPRCDGESGFASGIAIAARVMLSSRLPWTYCRSSRLSHRQFECSTVHSHVAYAPTTPRGRALSAIRFHGLHPGILVSAPQRSPKLCSRSGSPGLHISLTLTLQLVLGVSYLGLSHCVTYRQDGWSVSEWRDTIK